MTSSDTTSDAARSKFTLGLVVDGTTASPDDVNKLVDSIVATITGSSGQPNVTVKIKYDPKELHDLQLGDITQQGLRRSDLGSAGIFTIEQLCARSGTDIRTILGPSGLKAVRYALYHHEPRLSLVDEDPDQFPLRIDSLPISGHLHTKLTTREILWINQLTENLIAQFDLKRAIAWHDRKYANKPK
jgi:hypothetical protein